ncbi:MAG TPA: hypothetical protein VNS19_21635 [Acidimicrobiales bacterium]|nr:hypothetical protein [Acidimicrobiales bacterium]
MPIDPKDPEYALRWPPHLFAEEMSRLVAAAKAGSWDDSWDEQVETLLRQAFAGGEPAREFRELLDIPTKSTGRYDGEEPSDAAIAWLSDLVAIAEQLPSVQHPRPYWSQRTTTTDAGPEVLGLAEVAERFRKLVDQLETDRYFSRSIGYECVDGHGGEVGSIDDKLGELIGKADLWSTPTTSWTLDDLCDAIEVLHDLAARPTAEYFHNYFDCGWHLKKWSIASGRRLYTWQVNALLESSDLGLRLADTGEDTGRVVELAPSPLEPLVSDVLDVRDASGDEVAHAIAMFRRRGADRNDQRLAIIELARVLESRRPFIKQVLNSKDEGVLFGLANSFDLRHNDHKQKPAYGDEFLPWIFYYYLATLQLTDDLSARGAAGD